MKLNSKILTLILVALIFLALGGYLAYTTFFAGTGNYAKDSMKSLDQALTKRGAVKKCSQEDNGRGSDNRNPWYSALYEIPGDMATVTKTVFESASQSGFTLVDSKASVDAQDNKFYEDVTSKKSSYSALEPGNVSLLVEVYGSKVFSGDKQLCGVKPGPSSNGSTTVDVMLRLPTYKE